jgi:hypothetical protein
MSKDYPMPEDYPEDRISVVDLLAWYLEQRLDPNDQSQVRPWRRNRLPGDDGDG